MFTTLELSRAQQSPLHDIVRVGLLALRERLEEAGRWLPSHVRRELTLFEACGDSHEGFAWLTCGPCDHHLLVPFSCKGRGFCPRCGGRRMAEKSARWVDELFPKVAVRQWVLTVPWGLRWELARSPELTTGVLRVLIQRLQRYMRRRLGQPRGRTGSVTVIQRFGSALNLNVHFHVLMLDGLYVERDGRQVFHRCPRLSTRHVEELVVDIAARAQSWLARHRDEDDGPDPEAALPLLQAASLQGRSALTGRRAARTQRVGGREFNLPPRCGADPFSWTGWAVVVVVAEP